MNGAVAPVDDRSHPPATLARRRRQGYEQPTNACLTMSHISTLSTLTNPIHAERRCGSTHPGVWNNAAGAGRRPCDRPAPRTETVWARAIPAPDSRTGPAPQGADTATARCAREHENSRPNRNPGHFTTGRRSRRHMNTRRGRYLPAPVERATARSRQRGGCHAKRRAYVVNTSQHPHQPREARSSTVHTILI